MVIPYAIYGGVSFNTTMSPLLHHVAQYTFYDACPILLAYHYTFLAFQVAYRALECAKNRLSVTFRAVYL